MPITRFEIRNHYTLADSQLYRPADKDDPEALLEGLAMAALVGLLRQLGDLAEFAAETFHNLHDQVMATAARGHSLMIRLQQLEADAPSIETAFLSQTDHSSTFYNSGIDWHPNLRMDTNLLTHGDMPRFIMDSYEECRPPPRLFLLDKFDVAGAGACLKRYTNPSFFKVETDDMINADIQWEKRILKLRKKGPRLKIGETTEASNTKLHQLFLEERTENGVNKNSNRVKLKRRLNGFPFDSRTGRSYMEKILKSPSPDHEVDVFSLFPATSDENESGPEALQVKQMSPDRGSVARRSFHPSPDREEIVLNSSVCEPAGVSVNDQIDVIPAYHGLVKGGTSPTVDKETAEKVIAVDAENNSEGYFTGYASSAVASEVENFVDATSILEAEMDIESEFPMKNDLILDAESQAFISDANEEHQSTWISDCQSSGDSMLSDEGNSSCRKEMSGCSSSDYAITSAENQQSESSCNRISSQGTPEIEVVVSSTYQSNADQAFPVDQLPRTVACGDTCISIDAINCHLSDFEQRANLLSNGIPSLVHSESKGVVTEENSKQPEDDDMPSAMDDNQKQTNIADQPFYPVSYIEFQSRDNSANFFADRLLNEPEDEMVPCESTVPDTNSCNLLHDDGAAREDENMAENTFSSLNMLTALSEGRNDAPEVMPTTPSIPSESDDEGPELLETVSSDYFDSPRNEDDINSTVPQENLFGKLGNEVSNGLNDGITHSSNMVEASFGQEVNETLLANTQTLTSENLEMPHLVNSLDQPQEELDADKKDVLPEQVTMGNRSFALESSTSYDIVGLHATGTIKHDLPIYSEPVGSSFHATENLVEPAETSDAVEMVGITTGISSVAQEFVGVSHSADLKSPNEAELLVDEPDSEEERSKRDEVSTVCIISDGTTIGKAQLNVGLSKVEELVHCHDDSALDELENGNNYLSGSREEAVGHVKEIRQMEAAALDSEAVLSNRGHGNYPILEVSDAVLDSHPEFSNATTIQSPKHDVFLQRGPGNDILDANSFSIDCETEELRPQEEAGLPTNQHLSHSGEITSELLSSLSSSPLQTEGDNDATPALSLVDSSTSKLLRQSNHDVGLSGYPMNPLGSVYSPYNPSTESDKVNLADVPPLPPLPPVQWRMGKFQQDLVSMESGVIENIDISPQIVALLDASADDASSSLANTSPDDASSLPMATATDYVSLSNDEMTNSLLEEATSCQIQTAPKLESEEKKAKSNCSILEIKDMCEAIDVVPNVEEKLPRPETTQLLLEVAAQCPIQTASNLETKEEETKSSCSTMKNNDIRETVDTVTNTEDKQQQSEMARLSLEAILGPIQSAPKPEPKEEKARNICSILEFKGTHAMIDVVPNIEQKQNQSEMTTFLLEEATHPVQPVPESEPKEKDSALEIKDMSKTADVVPHLGGKPAPLNELMSPEEDKGLSYGSRKVKLPLPRNPLVEDVSVLDKSKLRKVTPHEKPQIQKVGERDAFLEQIRNKSFNLKPTMAMRPTIHQPKTNLRVAAILEKANAIRQALAGSDDDEDDDGDDDDCWSDS